MPEAADRGQRQGLAELFESLKISGILFALRPVRKHIDQFLRTHATGNTLAAGFVAVKLHRIQCHVEHAGFI